MRIGAAAVCLLRSSQQVPRDLVTRAFVVLALVALSSCVDKTPPPLWPIARPEARVTRSRLRLRAS